MKKKAEMKSIDTGYMTSNQFFRSKFDFEKSSIRSSRPLIDFTKEFTPASREGNIFSPRVKKLAPLQNMQEGGDEESQVMSSSRFNRLKN